MFDPATLVAFAPAVATIVVAPGPDTMYAVTQSLGHGRRAGVVAAFGTATGVLLRTAAAVLGLSALLRTSALAYTLVTSVGAAYLVFLGVRTVRSDEEFERRPADGDDAGSLADSDRKAVVVNVSNPKVAVFVLAFFPQFVPASANATVQLSILGLVYAALSLCYLAAVAVFASRTRHALLGSTGTRRLVRYASGSVLVGFGLKLAFDHRTVA